MPRYSLRRELLCTYPNLFRAFDSVRTPEGIQASNARHFKGAVFGRDSEEVGFDIVADLPDLSEQIIFSLARHQGFVTDPISEEEPGRIHHEHRSLVIGGQKVDAEVEQVFYRVGEQFGMNTSTGEWTYYGAVDATPNFVRLVAVHCYFHGRDILQRTFIAQDGSERTIRQAVEAAVNWTYGRLRSSELGLVEFHRTNPDALQWHVMRDGRTSHMHEDGSLANLDAPIAPLDVQGLAYDALNMAAELFPRHKQAKGWRELASNLQATTLKHFWLEDRGYFAMAIDRDENGHPRPIKTASSVQFELLDTRLFDSLPEADQQKYVGAIVRAVFSQEFLTPVGVRMRSRDYAGLVDYYEYQGSLASWVVTTNRTARGLRRYGLWEAGRYLEDCFVEGMNSTGFGVEFWYVDADDTPVYFAQIADPSVPKHILATNLPEDTQAWTVSAGLRALYEADRDVARTIKRAAWKSDLVAEVERLLQLPYSAYVDEKRGQAAEDAYVAGH